MGDTIIEVYDPAPFVQAGVTVLDENFPDWRKRIDKKALDIRHGDRCMLAQSSGVQFWAALESLLGDDTLREVLADWADEHGFRVSNRVMYNPIAEDDPYARLQQAWLDELRQGEPVSVGAGSAGADS